MAEEISVALLKSRLAVPGNVLGNACLFQYLPCLVTAGEVGVLILRAATPLSSNHLVFSEPYMGFLLGSPGRSLADAGRCAQFA